MVIYKGKDYKDVSRKAANIMSAQIIMNPRSVLGLATGSTPVGMYQQLIKWYKKGDLDFSKITTVNLDEYKGLSPDNNQSYRYFMDQNLLNHINSAPLGWRRAAISAMENPHSSVRYGINIGSFFYQCFNYLGAVNLNGKMQTCQFIFIHIGNIVF